MSTDTNFPLSFVYQLQGKNKLRLLTKVVLDLKTVIHQSLRQCQWKPHWYKRKHSFLSKELLFRTEEYSQTLSVSCGKKFSHIALVTGETWISVKKSTKTVTRNKSHDKRKYYTTRSHQQIVVFISFQTVGDRKKLNFAKRRK
jgi:hypothetical protein